MRMGMWLQGFLVLLLVFVSADLMAGEAQSDCDPKQVPLDELWEELDCRGSAIEFLIDEVRKVRTLSPGHARTFVQPAGAHATIVFPRKVKVDEVFAAVVWRPTETDTFGAGDAPRPNSVHRKSLPSGYCVGADDTASNPITDVTLPGGSQAEAQRLPVISVVSQRDPQSGAESTLVRLEIPRVVESWRWCDAYMAVGLFKRENGKSGGPLVITAGTFKVEWFSTQRLAWTITILFSLLIYGGTVLALYGLRRRQAEKWDEQQARAPKQNRQPEAEPWRPSLLRSFDPIVITGSRDGAASTSVLQVFGFSVLVSSILVFVMARLGTLSDLSTDVLLLLGISAVGTAGAKLTGQRRQRLAMENWAWLRRKHWPMRSERGPSWGQLLTAEGQFDVTKFQMLIFSLVVGFGIVAHGSVGLGTFEIPDSLLGVLGLSQAIYITGKAVPVMVSDYDKKLKETRRSENAFVAAVVAKAGEQGVSPPTELHAARELAQTAYDEFAENIGQSAVMHEAVFGQEVPQTLRQPRLPQT